jgi:hypothetical protein
MGLHWGGDYVAKCLPPHLIARLEEARTNLGVELTPEQETRFEMVNGKTGETVAGINANTTRRVTRRKLRALFATDLDIKVHIMPGDFMLTY